MNRSIEEQLQKEGFYISTTVGTSMWPMLRNRRDRVLIRPTDGRELARFDLALYLRPDGKYVLHRVIDVKDDHYVIRGDNTYVKEFIPKEWILGVMTEFWRADRHRDADRPGYRLYVRLWNAIYPIRLPIRKLWFWSYRVLRRLKARLVRRRDS